MQKKWLTAAVVGVLTSGLYMGVAAEEVYTLETVIVTATRTDKSILEAPANAQVVTKEEFEKAGYTDVFDAIKNMSQANAHTYMEDGGNYGGMTARIRLRGIDQGTLVLINGIPATFSNSSSLANIPMNQVERVEVVKGAGSVLYGPQAMGGVVNVITKTPSEQEGFNGSAFGSYGSYYKDIGVDFMSSRIGFGYKKSWSGDLNDIGRPSKMGAGTALKTVDKSTEQWYLTGRLSDYLTLSYGRTGTKASYISGKFVDFKPNFTDRCNQETIYENYGFIYDSPENGWRVAGGYNTMDIDVDYDENYPVSWGKSRYKGYNTSLDAQKQIALRNDLDNLVLGATVQRERMRYSAGNNPYQVNAFNSFSLYQSYDRQINEKLNLIFGLREYYMAESDYLDSRFEVLPQVQGLYKVDDKSSWYFNVGRSFEMPGVSQFFYYSGNHAVNKDLKPQSSWSYEIGYKWEDEKRSFTADVFYMTAKDKFYWGKTEDDKNIMMNRDKWRNYGLELSYNYALNDRQTLYLGATLQNPKAQSAGEGWVQDTAKYILNVGTTYTTGKWSADLRVFSYFDRENAYYRHDGTSTYFNEPDHTLSDYIDVALTVTYRVNEESTLRLACKNLFDRDNVINNYEYYATPANYTLTYEYKF